MRSAARSGHFETCTLRALIGIVLSAVFSLIPVSSTHAAPTGMEQQCFDAVQGKVAYNQQGARSWNESNVRALCQGTTNPVATISCFQTEIRTHNSWQRGIEACKPAAAARPSVPSGIPGTASAVTGAVARALPTGPAGGGGPTSPTAPSSERPQPGTPPSGPTARTPAPVDQGHYQTRLPAPPPDVNVYQQQPRYAPAPSPDAIQNLPPGGVRADGSRYAPAPSPENVRNLPPGGVSAQGSRYAPAPPPDAIQNLPPGGVRADGSRYAPAPSPQDIQNLPQGGARAGDSRYAPAPRPDEIADRRYGPAPRPEEMAGSRSASGYQQLELKPPTSEYQQLQLKPSQPPGYAAPPVTSSQPPGYSAPPVTRGAAPEVEVGGRAAPTASAPKSGGAVGRAGAAGGTSAAITALALGASGQEVKLHDPTKLQVRGPVKDLCWLDSYGNGAGEVQNGCAPDREWRDGMCYRKCAAGETGSMTMCKTSCPDGYQSDPLTCRRDTNVIAADTSACPWHDKCGLVTARGCSKCPAGYTNDGCTCRIDAHVVGRTIRDVGIGLAGSGCGAGLTKDPSGLLCYPTCKPGYDMVGPVCWQHSCPADFPVRCGLACAVSNDACALGVVSQVLKPIEVVTNIVGAVLTGGSSTVASAGAKVAATGAKVAAKAAGPAAIKASMQAAAKRAGKELSEQTLSTASSTFASAELTGSFSWYDLDPTGIAGVVEAYDKPICKAPPK